MRAASAVLAAILTVVFISAPQAFAQDTGAFDGAGAGVLGVPPEIEGAEVYEGPARTSSGERPSDYYTQKVEAIQGVITAVDPENSTVVIMSGDAETLYRYDGLTRFQVKLKPICPTDLKAGAKVAGLYREKDGSLYISRVVVITGEPYKAVKKKPGKRSKSSKCKKSSRHKKSSKSKKKRRRR